MRASFVLAAAILMSSAAAPAFAGGVAVTIDQSIPVRVSGSAAQVVVANPAIADVSLLDRHQFVIMGRTYGTTNIMVFDGLGRSLYNGVVTVTPPSSNQVALYRGPNSHHFTCASHCERTPVPGESDPDDYKNFANPVRDYADRAKAAGQASGQQP